MTKKDQMHEVTYFPGNGSLQELPAHIFIADEIDRGTAINHSKGTIMDKTIEEKLATAIAAATEFKYMLDIQRPGSLYYPRRKKIDPRDSACYKKAAADLLNLILQEHDGSQRPTDVLLGTVVVGNRVANDGADAGTRPRNVLSDVIVALANLGIEKISYDVDGGKDGGLVVLGFCDLSGLEKIAKLAHGENDIIHKTS